MNSGQRSVKLEEICAQITDGKHGDCQDEADSGFYFLSCKDVSDGKLNYENARQISETDFVDTHRRTKLAASDVLITNSGTIGRMAIAADNDLTQRTTFQKSVAILKPIPSQVEARFLYYRLQSDMRRLVEFAGGTAQKNLLLRDLRAFPVELPSLPIQRRIVGILSAYDNLIENNSRRLQILEQMAQTLYREWFVQFRFPGHEKIKLVEAPLGKIPQGWNNVRIGERFKTVLGGTPSRAKPEFWIDGTIPWINSGKINELRIVDASELITAKSLTKSATKLMPRRTTVLAITGATLGQVSLLEIEACANQSVVGIVDSSSVYSEYLYLKTKEVIGELVNHASGGAQQHINKEVVNEFEIVLPPERLVIRFNELCKPFFNLLVNKLHQNANLRRTRDLLLPKLISGELFVENTGSNT